MRVELTPYDRRRAMSATRRVTGPNCLTLIWILARRYIELVRECHSHAVGKSPKDACEPGKARPHASRRGLRRRSLLIAKLEDDSPLFRTPARQYTAANITASEVASSGESSSTIRPCLEPRMRS